MAYLKVYSDYLYKAYYLIYSLWKYRLIINKSEIYLNTGLLELYQSEEKRKIKTI